MVASKTVLVVDDSKSTLKVIAAILKDEGFTVLTAASGGEALEIFHRNKGRGIAAVLSDLKMPKMNGIQLFQELSRYSTPPPFVIMTAYGTVQSAVQALKEGVANYLIKPLNYEELVVVLNKAVHEYFLRMELEALKEHIGRENSFHGMIGSDPKMLHIFEQIQTVGATDVSVMIYGETGTGKELLARALHEESARREENLVCINSAALSENLLEAELFGYVKGSFTGALSDRKGRLEAAHQGTLFLDEIGHMSLRLQSKLLRFFQEKSFEPVGGSTCHSVDVRVIAATNLNLQAEIKAGRFLNDLLYRIEVVPFRLPALRERKQDIYLLVDHFMRQLALQYKKQIQGVSPEAMEALADYAWPGNIRELKNVMARAVILSKSTAIKLEDLPRQISLATNSKGDTGKVQLFPHIPEAGITLRQAECELIRKTLEKYNGNKSLAAQCLGISRKTLYEKIERYSITDP